MSGLIRAVATAPPAFARRLARKATLLASAHAQEHRQGPLRWRKPGLLWPLFTRKE